jgi:RNA polymerase sigma-70 factor (ECF subfamily)
MKRYRSRLRRMVSFRMDPRLQSRVDPSDVVQDVCLEAWQCLASYVSQPNASFYLWLRAVAGHKLGDLHRHHLGAQMRDAKREVSLWQGSLPGATSAALAAQLLGHFTRPSEAAVRAERKVQLQTALNAMDPIDREVLALRHFEQLTVSEAAAVLGIMEKAAGMRYTRALRRFKEILTSLGGLGEP